MQDLPLSHNVNNLNLERPVAQQHYFELRDKLVGLKSALEPDLAAIDSVVQELEQAQLAYKATFGLFGNNPLDDSELQTQSRLEGLPRSGGVD